MRQVEGRKGALGRVAPSSWRGPARCCVLCAQCVTYTRNVRLDVSIDCEIPVTFEYAVVCVVVVVHRTDK